MKQKNNQVKAKPNLKGVQKEIGVKKQKQAGPVAPVKEVATRKGRNQKVPVKTVPPKKVEEIKADEEDSDDEDDSGADVAAEEPAVDEDESEDEAENDEAEDDAEEDESAEDDGDAEENDDAPTEAPIEKTGKGETGGNVPYLIRSNPIKKDFPPEQVVFVKNMPPKGEFKQVDIVEVFAKYGTLHTIHPIYLPKGVTHVCIAYTTPEAATAALAADGATIKSAKINVSMKRISKQERLHAERQKAHEERKKHIAESRARVVFVKNLKTGTSEEQLRELFTPCGEIEEIRVVARNGFTYAFVTFTSVEPVQEAIKLNMTELNEATIGVYLHGDEKSKAAYKDPHRTVKLKNTQKLEKFPGHIIEKIFAECGEIENLDVVCKKNVLAFITFKEEASVKNALLLNGTTHDDLNIEIQQFQLPEVNTQVFIHNVRPGTDEEAIREFFKDTGSISTVTLKNTFAIVKFADIDGFCKSFLLNESFLAGRIVFLEPYSEKKKMIMKKNNLGGKRKLPFNNKAGGFKRPKPNTA